MDRVDVRPLVWAINRWFLVHGALAWVAAIGTVMLLGLLFLFAGSVRSYLETKAEWESRQATAMAGDSPPSTVRPLPFPFYAERFGLTATALEALKIDESLPEKISFTYDRNQDSGLVRQTATLNVDSAWQDVGQLLDRAQMAIPAAYISRLRVARDSDQDILLGAEVQLTLIYRDPLESVE